MSYLLDTNICSAYLKGNPRVFNRFIQYAGNLNTSTVVLGELYTWVNRTKTKPSTRDALADLLRNVQVLPVDHDVARQFGQIRAALLDAGRPAPELDLLIGCTAILYDLTLVTGNAKDFQNIPDLRIENWLVP